jgi:rhodanese-related sulfurtransferase
MPQQPFLSTIVLAALVGSSTTIVFFKTFDISEEKTNEELIEEFYKVENAVHVSPHSLRKQLDEGGTNVLIVDLRSAEEYEREHIIGAINIPAYSDPDTSAYSEVDRIVNQFKKAIETNPNKEIVTYCYSIPCMTGRKIGKLLADHGIYVKTLNIGWNEWRHFWTLWNHEHEWETTKPEDYISSGKEPGTPKIKDMLSPCGEGEFGC